MEPVKPFSLCIQIRYDERCQHFMRRRTFRFKSERGANCVFYSLSFSLSFSFLSFILFSFRDKYRRNFQKMKKINEFRRYQKKIRDI